MSCIRRHTSKHPEDVLKPEKNLKSDSLQSSDCMLSLHTEILNTLFFILLLFYNKNFTFKKILEGGCHLKFKVIFQIDTLLAF